MTSGRRGRRTRPYASSWGEDIPGLYRLPDGRWRITAPGKHHGQRFTEPDEAKAVAKARTLIAGAEPMVMVGEVVWTRQADGCGVYDGPAVSQVVHAVAQAGHQAQYERQGNVMVGGMQVPRNLLAITLRQMLAQDAEELAAMLGLPPRSFQRLALPKASIRLADVIEVYRRENPAAERSKREALAPLQRLVQYSGAQTLDDLTEKILMGFRDQVEAQVKGPATRRAYYGRIKSIIGFGLRVGMDAQQIRAFLDRAKVLWTAAAMSPPYVRR